MSWKFARYRLSRSIAISRAFERDSKGRRLWGRRRRTASGNTLARCVKSWSRVLLGGAAAGRQPEDTSRRAHIQRRPETFFHDSVAFMSLTKHLKSIIFNAR